MSFALIAPHDCCCLQVKLHYHIRVLIPCYKEDLEIVQRTVLAAREADLPAGCARTIYLCDDGKDPDKRAWIATLGPDVVYVSGRIRKKGEMNGKSGNLNNVARQIYPKVCPELFPLHGKAQHWRAKRPGAVTCTNRMLNVMLSGARIWCCGNIHVTCTHFPEQLCRQHQAHTLDAVEFLLVSVQDVPIPGSELLCIFDADQVARRVFFMRTVPLFDAGDDVGMVLSPQCFHNLNRHTDIFNHSNLQFWEYMQPGYDAWGFISCTGVHASALPSYQCAA